MESNVLLFKYEQGLIVFNISSSNVKPFHTIKV